MSPLQKDKIPPIIHFLIHVNVLVVLDGLTNIRTASFGPGDPNDGFFGLSEFIRVLNAVVFPPYHVTKAHRDIDPNGAADIQNFKFDAVDLSAFDEIWLFGVAASGGTNNSMTDSELAALTKFMNGGGGVFATGDHEDLGVELCGRVPRVRSMRKWYFPAAGPLGEPVAPPAIGSDRVETTQRRPGDTVTFFDDQSDDIPQPLTLRWYPNTSLFTLMVHPHPLMCGLKGAIRVAPDHMHEGEVITPWDLTATLTFNGQNFVEYPADSSGSQWPPEIVAWGRVIGEANVSTEGVHIGDPNIANPRTFGVVGAYDGHRVGVGRVAVDSTWHHFFNINLIGDPVAPFPKNIGFNASTQGQAALSEIENYYRNVALWLIRPGKLWWIYPAVIYAAWRAQPLNMIVNANRNYTYQDLIGLGRLGSQFIGGFLPPCSTYAILWSYLVAGPTRVIPPDPWAGAPGPGDPVFVDPVVMVEATIGGAVVALEKRKAEIDKLAPEQAKEIVLRAVQEGVSHGLRELGTAMGRYAEGLEKIARSWTENK